MNDFNSTLPYAYGLPTLEGTMKAVPDDFIVSEQLGFELTGEGEHLFLLIEKRGISTDELVKALAQSLQRPTRDISYAGLKDKHAVTRQWLCLHAPGKEVISLPSGNDTWRVLQQKRHNKKLKTGALAKNEFQLTIRHLQHSDTLFSKLTQIKSMGVPNYFGHQRFGLNGQNIAKAEALLLRGHKERNRFLKGLYFSVARSFLFNHILARRIEKDAWNKALAGDVMQLAGSNSIFTIEKPDETIASRISDFDVSPALPLWGKGEERAKSDALLLQTEALTPFLPWCAALEMHDLSRHYRAQILSIQSLAWQSQDSNLILHFDLPAGCYATSVLRELFVPVGMSIPS